MHTDGEGTHEIIAQHKIPVVVSFNTLWLLYRSSQEKKHPCYLRIHNICAIASKLKTRKHRIYAKLQREAQNFETEP